MTDLQKAEAIFMDKWLAAVKAAGGDPEKLMTETSGLVASMKPGDVELIEKALQAETDHAGPQTLN